MAAPAELVPARPARQWMDETTDRFAYRCVPMTAANALGWELLIKEPFSATWTGGAQKEDITFSGDFANGRTPAGVQSHFGHGIITFHPGYLFRTDPGWGILCRGAPNWPKDGISALDGFVETDWLPFTFTMNWMFTRPCTISFEAGEPFCFFSLVEAATIEAVEPIVANIEDNPELFQEFDSWQKSRREFNASLKLPGADKLKDQWQKFYVAGKTAAGTDAAASHRSKRKVKAPRTSGQTET